MDQDSSSLKDALRRYPELHDRICWTLLEALHAAGHVRLEPGADEAAAPLEDHVLSLATGLLDGDSLADLVNLTLKRDEAQSLEKVANLTAIPFGPLAEKVRAFCRLPQGRTLLPPDESISIRVSLIKRFITDQLEYIGVARDHLLIRDFEGIIDRIIGFQDGCGQIGGKAGGLLLGARILQRAQEQAGAPPAVAVHVPESYFLLTDVFEEFVRRSGLHQLRDHKYKNPEKIQEEYPAVKEKLAAARMPSEITRQLEELLEEVGDAPLVVRSSSLLEDRFGAVFAGKYDSVFVSNQGTRPQRLEELLKAIVQVYASVFHPDPMSYRARHNLLDYSETMAVLIQRSVGTRIGPYHLPVWAGVAFGHNLYRRNPRIRPEDGLARIVFGLGTRAVDRVDRDFPRMMPLGSPSLRAEVDPADVATHSQHEVDAVDVEQRRLTTVPLEEVLSHAGVVPGIGLVLSSLGEGYLRPLTGDGLLGATGDPVVTFGRFGAASPFPGFLRWCLQTLSEAYGCPVDIEYAFDGERFHLLQCRPQALPNYGEAVVPPEALPRERRIFSVDRDVVSGSVKGIAYVVLVDPAAYHRLPSEAERVRVARCVHDLNRSLPPRSFILLGPGRWGSKDSCLGVKVGYADINNAAMLIEIAASSGGGTAEVSFGSHFFQDLVESDIRYLALYPDTPGIDYNEDFLLGSDNALPSLLPACGDLSDVMRVIDVEAVTGGSRLRVDMDGDGQRALAYLPR